MLCPVHGADDTAFCHICSRLICSTCKTVCRSSGHETTELARLEAELFSPQTNSIALEWLIEEAKELGESLKKQVRSKQKEHQQRIKDIEFSRQVLQDEASITEAETIMAVQLKSLVNKYLKVARTEVTRSKLREMVPMLSFPDEIPKEFNEYKSLISKAEQEIQRIALDITLLNSKLASVNYITTMEGRQFTHIDRLMLINVFGRRIKEVETKHQETHQILQSRLIQTQTQQRRQEMSSHNTNRSSPINNEHVTSPSMSLYSTSTPSRASQLTSTETHQPPSTFSFMTNTNTNITPHHMYLSQERSYTTSSCCPQLYKAFPNVLDVSKVKRCLSLQLQQSEGQSIASSPPIALGLNKVDWLYHYPNIITDNSPRYEGSVSVSFGQPVSSFISSSGSLVFTCYSQPQFHLYLYNLVNDHHGTLQNTGNKFLAAVEHHARVYLFVKGSQNIHFLPSAILDNKALCSADLPPLNVIHVPIISSSISTTYTNTHGLVHYVDDSGRLIEVNLDTKRHLALSGKGCAADVVSSASFPVPGLKALFLDLDMNINAVDNSGSILHLSSPISSISVCNDKVFALLPSLVDPLDFKKAILFSCSSIRRWDEKRKKGNSIGIKYNGYWLVNRVCSDVVLVFDSGLSDWIFIKLK